MDTSLFKVAVKSQTHSGAVQFLVVFLVLGGVLVSLEVYHANDRLTFKCSPKPDDFARQLCYDKYTSTMSPWLIPRNVVAIIYSVLCVCWICSSFYSAVKIRQIKRVPEAQLDQRQALLGTFYCAYVIHVVFRLVFLGGMIVAFCSSQTLDLPLVFECSPNKTATSVNQTEHAMQCNDLHYKEKSNLNIAILVIEALVMMLGISEFLQLTLKRMEFPKMLLGNVFEEGTDTFDMEDLSPPGDRDAGETKNIKN